MTSSDTHRYITGNMDCFKVEWRRSCPIESAQEFIPSPILGVYAVCRTNVKAAKRVWYIGTSKDFAQRMRDHLQDWSRVLTPAQMKRLTVSFGTIHALEGSMSVLPEDIHSVESLLRFKLKPPGNDPKTCERYTGKHPILIGNIGELKFIDKFMTSIHDLDELLHKKRGAKKRKASRDPLAWVPKI